MRVLAAALTAIAVAAGPSGLRADDKSEFSRLGKQCEAEQTAGQIKDMLRTALKMQKLAAGPLKAEPAYAATAAQWLGSAYMHQCRYAEAEALMKRSLAIHEAASGAGGVSVAGDLKLLGTLYRNQARFAEAEPLLKRAIAICEARRGPEHVSVAGNLGTLASVYQRQARYAEAEPLLKRAIEINEKAVGPDHPWVATWLKELAALDVNQARYADAEAHLKRAITICEKAQGAEHASVAGNLAALASVYRYQGRFAEAEQLYKRAQAIHERTFGPDYFPVADDLDGLALVYQSQGRYAEAEAVFKRALAIHEKILGTEYPAVAGDLRNLASLYSVQGRFAEAEPLLKRAVAIGEKTYGPEHPFIAGIVGRLARLYIEQARYAEGDPLLKRAVAINEKAVGPEHPWVADWLDELAISYSRQQRYAEAEPLYQRCLKIYEKAVGTSHPKFATGLHNLGTLYDKQGRYAEAEALLRRALAIREKTLGPDHSGVGWSLYRLARVDYDRGQYAEAEPLVDRAIAILDRAGYAPGRRFECYLFRARLDWKKQLPSEALADLHEAMQLAEQQRAESSGSAHERAETFTKYDEAFEQMVAWQLELKDMSEVLAAMERGRARSLLEEMSSSGVDLQAGRSAAEREALRKQELELKQKVEALEQQIEALADDPKRSAGEKLAQQGPLQAALAGARTALYEFYRDQRASSPVYRQLLSAGGGPPRLSRIQRRLAGKDGLLLAYLFGSDGGYLLTIGPAKAELAALVLDDSAAKALGVQAGPLTAERLAAALENDAGTGVVQLLRDPKQSAHVAGKLAALWHVLIPPDQRQALTGGTVKRLIVIPDGKLSLLPFETLVVEPREPPVYLLDAGPPIECGPSATVLYNLVERPATAAVAQREPVLTVGNPDYGGPGEQVAAKPADTLNQVAARSRYRSLGGRLTDLPYSGWESSWVAETFQKAGIKTVRLERGAATKAKVCAEMEGRQIIHLACHGLADQSYGNYFGALALAPNQLPAGTGSDGLLTLSEIYGLNLHGAELTILSACETNYGPQQRGEGVWALSRGFLVAGSRRVVASNWLVDDEAAATLITFFCSGVAQARQKGETPDYADSLQKAKRLVRREEKWSSPYFWGSLVLVGPN
jgi:tetratricopeptide (TPR) repeat protein/CHAT domain-containing protein